MRTPENQVLFDQFNMLRLSSPNGEEDAKAFVERIGAVILGYPIRVMTLPAVKIGSYSQNHAFALRVYEPGLGLPTCREDWLDLLRSGIEVESDYKELVDPAELIAMLNRPAWAGMRRTPDDDPGYDVNQLRDFAVDECNYDFD